MSNRAMRFVVEKVTSSGVRLGKIAVETNKSPTSRIELETPLCLVHTRSGLVPCLTPDILEHLSLPSALQLSVATLYEQPGTDTLEVFKEGLHRFLGQEEHLLYLSVHDPHSPPPMGYNDKNSVSVWCSGGRRKLTVEDHIKFVEASQPDIFEALFDSASSQTNKLKRIRKSVDRTLSFLDEVLKRREQYKTCAVLGAIVGGDELEERKRSATETASRAVDGFVLEGFDLPYSKNALGSVISCVTAELPHDKPRFVHALHTPSDIFTALERGVDVFDSSYCLTAAEKGLALTYHNSLSDALPDTQSTGACGLELDLCQSQYAADFNPILSGCCCYGCSYYSRAYIHHLLSTKELLGQILLMVHNLTHLFKFFHNLSVALRAGKYQNFRDSYLFL